MTANGARATRFSNGFGLELLLSLCALLASLTGAFTARGADLRPVESASVIERVVEVVAEVRQAAVHARLQVAAPTERVDAADPVSHDVAPLVGRFETSERRLE